MHCACSLGLFPFGFLSTRLFFCAIKWSPVTHSPVDQKDPSVASWTTATCYHAPAAIVMPYLASSILSSWQLQYEGHHLCQSSSNVPLDQIWIETWPQRWLQRPWWMQWWPQWTPSLGWAPLDRRHCPLCHAFNFHCCHHTGTMQVNNQTFERGGCAMTTTSTGSMHNTDPPTHCHMSTKTAFCFHS